MKNEIVAIRWLDAADHTEINKEDIVSSIDYLVERTTYGVVLIEDEHGIVLMRDETDDGTVEITVIPKRMIIEE
jgi:Ni2+-binding GTPase involved in maturation of urease and hydrogenase